MSHEFASLQLTLVDRYVELGLGTYAEGLNRLTNFQRRLGLGAPTEPASNSQWITVVSRMEAQPSHAARVHSLMNDFEKLPPAIPEHIVHGWPTVGAFSIQVVGDVARTHFFSMDSDDESPLHPTKLGTRRNELHTVLSTVRASHPGLTSVVGGSWLYSTRSYQSLFPQVHVRNARVRRNRQTFQGMSHWGQFLDHQWRLRTNLADQFREHVRAWEGDDPCALFPINTLEVSSPIEAFDLPHAP